MTHRLSNCDFVTLKIKSFGKRWLYYFSHSLYNLQCDLCRSSHVGGRVFFSLSCRSGRCYLAGSCESQDWLSPRFKIVTSLAPRGAATASSETTVWVDASVANLTSSIQPAFKGAAQLVADTCKVFEHLNIAAGKCASGPKGLFTLTP